MPVDDLSVPPDQHVEGERFFGPIPHVDEREGGILVRSQCRTTSEAGDSPGTEAEEGTAFHVRSYLSAWKCFLACRVVLNWRCVCSNIFATYSVTVTNGVTDTESVFSTPTALHSTQK